MLKLKPVSSASLKHFLAFLLRCYLLPALLLSFFTSLAAFDYFKDSSLCQVVVEDFSIFRIVGSELGLNTCFVNISLDLS